MSVKRHWTRNTGTSWDVGLIKRSGGRYVLATHESRQGAEELAALVRQHLRSWPG